MKAPPRQCQHQAAIFNFFTISIDASFLAIYPSAEKILGIIYRTAWQFLLLIIMMSLIQRAQKGLLP
jgi:hypothetical protein